MLASAKQKLHAGAYLHWYTQHGVTKDKFHEAFYMLEDMLEDYEAAKQLWEASNHTTNF